MYRLLGFLSIALFLPLLGKAQIFVGQGNLLVPPGAPGSTVGVTVSEATVSGVGRLSNCSVLERVLMNIDHTYTGDVAIFLISPAGTILELTSTNGGSQDNWRNTTFRDDATRFITAGNPPFTGTFRPEGRQQSLTPPFTNAPALGTFTLENTFAGEDADGVWQLYVNDYVAVDVGRIINWELEFTSSSSTLNADIQASTTDICQGDPVDISVIGNVPATATFAWAGGQTSPSITVNPAGPTTYAVTVTDGVCEQELEITLTPDLPPTILGESTICNSGSVRLTAAGGGPYVWSTGATSTSINVSPGSTTDYTVSNGSGSCNTSEAFTVTVQPIGLNLDASATGICAGSPVTLTARGGSPTATYAWSTGETTRVITPEPTTSTEYAVTLSEGTCTRTARVLIIAYNTSVDAGPDRSVCSGELVSLVGTGTGPFLWSTGERSDFILVRPDVTTTYTATATQGTCIVVDTVVVTVIPDAAVAAGPDQSTCARAPVELTASGSGPFTWSDGQTGERIIVSPAATTTYTVSVGSGACSATDDVTVTVTEQPTLELGANQSYCAGGPSTLTANGNFDNISWSTGATSRTIDLQTEGTISYTATASIGSCVVEDSVTVSVFPTVSVAASPDTTVCIGSTARLTATGTGPFTWSTGETAPSITVSPAVATNYTVTAGGGACALSDEVTVGVTEQPTLELGPDQSYCAGGASTLTATGNFDNISWNTGASSRTIDLQTEGAISYTATASIGSCVVEDSVTVSVFPTVSVAASPDTAVCVGSSARLTAAGTGPFTWSTGETADSITVNPAVTTNYTVTAGGGACALSDEVRVGVTPRPTADLGPDRTSCINEVITLNNSEPADELTWNDGGMATSRTLTVTADTTIMLTVTTDNCTASDTLNVFVSAPTVDLGPDQTICAGDSVILRTPAATDYSWSTGFGGPTLRVAPLSDTEISVELTIDNCPARDTVAILIAESLSVNAGEDASICPGDSTVLTAVSAAAVRWNTGDLGENLTVRPAARTVFFATVGSGNCAVTDSVEVVVLPEATVDLGEDLAICLGTDTLLTAGGNARTFFWSTGEAAPAITVAPVIDTSYQITATTNDGCTAMDSVSVRVIVPRLSIEPAPAICPGDVITLTATEADEYLWGDGSTSPAVTRNPMVTTTYVLTGFTEGCPLQDSVEVRVTPLASVDAGQDRTICPGDSVTLSAVGDGPFTWSTGFVGSELRVRPDGPANYQVRAGSGNCANSATVSVDQFPAVTVDLGEDRSICLGDSAVLSVDAGQASVDWADGSFGLVRTVDPSEPTVYFVTASQNGCTAQDSVEIRINELPTVNLLDQECSVDNATFSVSLGITGGEPAYLFNGQDRGARIDSAGIPSETLVEATVTDANGCSASFSQFISCGCRIIDLAEPLPTCTGSADERDLSELLPPGAPAGEWSVISAGSARPPMIVGGQLSPLGADAGSYTLQYTPAGAALDCLPDYRTVIRIENPPVAGSQVFVEERCAESAGLLQLAEELVGATPGGEWFPASGNTIDNEAVNASAGTFLATDQGPGDYVFRYQAPDGFGCPGETADVIIRLVEIEVAGLVAIPNCEETCSGAITVLEPALTNLYALNEETLGSATTFTDLCPGDYELRTENDRGCTAMTTLRVEETIIPTITVAGQPELVLGDSTLLEVISNVSVDTVRWSPFVNCQDPACRTIYARPFKTTEYTLTLVSDAGCETSSALTVFVDERVGVYVPTAFSPNGDNINDLLTVYAGEEITEVNDFQIYDRWGSRVANFPRVDLGNSSFGWDGNSDNGKRLQVGVYIYRLAFTRIDGSVGTLAGEVILMR